MTTRGNILVQIALDLYNKWVKYECSEVKNNVIRCNNGELTFVKHKDGDSWCGAFVSTIISIYNSNYNDDTINITLSASTLTIYNSAKQNGYKIDKRPEVGALFYRRYSNAHCKQSGSASNCGHVGIVYKVDFLNNKIVTIEGNVNDKVGIITKDLTEFLESSEDIPEGNYIIHIEDDGTNIDNSNLDYINIRNYYL
jgi:hypothetical protein